MTTSVLYGDGRYTDLKIVCGDWKWKVHRVVLRQRAPSLLWHLEHVSARQIRESQNTSTSGQVLSHRRKVYWPNDWSTKENCNAIMQYVYRANYMPIYNERPYDEASAMLTHLRVYTFADRANIPLIKAEAKENFRLACQQEVLEDAFAAAIDEVFSEDAAASNPVDLQDIMLEVVIDNGVALFALPETSAFTQSFWRTSMGAKLGRKLLGKVLLQPGTRWDETGALYHM